MNPILIGFYAWAFMGSIVLLGLMRILKNKGAMEKAHDDLLAMLLRLEADPVFAALFILTAILFWPRMINDVIRINYKLWRRPDRLT